MSDPLVGGFPPDLCPEYAASFGEAGRRLQAVARKAGWSDWHQRPLTEWGDLPRVISRHAHLSLSLADLSEVAARLSPQRWAVAAISILRGILQREDTGTRDHIEAILPLLERMASTATPPSAPKSIQWDPPSQHVWAELSAAHDRAEELRERSAKALEPVRVVASGSGAANRGHGKKARRARALAVLGIGQAAVSFFSTAAGIHRLVHLSSEVAYKRGLLEDILRKAPKNTGGGRPLQLLTDVTNASRSFDYYRTLPEVLLRYFHTQAGRALDIHAAKVYDSPGPFKHAVIWSWFTGTPIQPRVLPKRKPDHWHPVTRTGSSPVQGD